MNPDISWVSLPAHSKAVCLFKHQSGGDPLGQFAIEHIQNEWKVFVRKPLDREEKDNYLLNITASDGIFTAKATVEVKVLDANDNSPRCEKVLSFQQPSRRPPPLLFPLTPFLHSFRRRSTARASRRTPLPADSSCKSPLQMLTSAQTHISRTSCRELDLSSSSLTLTQVCVCASMFTCPHMYANIRDSQGSAS